MLPRTRGTGHFQEKALSGTRFSVQTSPDGSYRIESDSVQLSARMLPPRIEGDGVRRLSFARPYREELGIGGIRAPGLGRWWTLSVSNWTDESVTQEVDLAVARLPDEVREVAVFEFFHQRFEGVMARDAKFTTSIPPHGTRLFRLAPWYGTMPVVLGTDRHLSGGGCEIKEIEVDRDRVRGRVETAWEYPVRITALFPFEDRRKLLRTIARADDRRFELSLEASRVPRDA